MIELSFLRWPGSNGPTAGLVCIEVNDVILHLLLRDPRNWKMWGRSTESYDHCLEYFGLGPLALLVWPGGKRFLDALTAADLNAPAPMEASPE